MNRTELLIIDPQNDFCYPGGSLFVDGAHEDMGRLGTFIYDNYKNITKIHVTLDSHHAVHIAHSVFWINSKGEHPDPFTIITSKDLADGVWRARSPALQDWSKHYLARLEDNGKYPLCIWPDHCIVGTIGHNIISTVQDALNFWETKQLEAVWKNFQPVNYIHKGSNYRTEHYSALKADVPIEEDVNTFPNRALVESLWEADDILVAGEASSHCVASTVIDLTEMLPAESYRKITLISDAMSPVTGFEKMEQEFLQKMDKLGVKRITTRQKL